MKSDAITVLDIFDTKIRLEVPLFQRQYVWNQEKQWEPLWEDISRKFSEYIEGRKEAPVHFLGAMVLDQKQSPTGHVQKRQVVDGQQRLATLQIFLAAFRDFCSEHGCQDIAEECETFTLNKGKMADPAVDKYKVWPTLLDREQFADVIDSRSRVKLEEKYPFRLKKYTRKPEPRPRMVEAYVFFHDRLKEFFLPDGDGAPLAVDTPLEDRLDECFQALKNALKVVVIDLDSEDDAQVIFETLNARGEPLLPADLVRNFIFLRAARQDELQEHLYTHYWQPFDDPFWRVEVKQGRLFRPRSDLFMQHFVASRQTVDIPIKHLYVEYKFWIERQRPFTSVEDELKTLARQRDDFRRILEPKRADTLYGLSTFLDTFDVRTSYPLLLAMLDVGLGEDQWVEASTILESYLLRRAVCGLTTKNYNRVFLSLTRSLRRDVLTPDTLAKQLKDLTGDSAEWPTDAAFSEAWRTRHAYQTLNNPKIVHILKRLNDTYTGSKTEAVVIDGKLTVEHLLPQDWNTNWPLPDGSRGYTTEGLLTAAPEDPRAEATRKRNIALQTFGNLTILTQGLNSAASNSAWEDKKPEILRHSLLPINQLLQPVAVWDEFAIAQRSENLLKRALTLWPRV